MEDLQRRGTVGVLDLASRRAEEAALRRYQAVHWLDYLVGPLGIPSQPSQKQFISCLRNGLVLCNIINKVQPGSVSKVIEKTAPIQSLPWDSQPLPAYQYFENIRNFLVAVEELRLPTFDASVFERENLVEGSSAKVVDCILALKDYHEWKQMTGGVGLYKPPRSPLILNSAGRICPKTPGLVSSNSSRQLDMSGGSNKPMPSESDIRKGEETIVKVLAEHMVGSKENIDNNLVASYHRGNVQDPANFLSWILSSFEEQLRKKYPEVKLSMDHLRERSCSPLHAKFVPLANLSNLENCKCCRACLKKGNCNHWNLVKQQEDELSNIKMLLSSAKQEAKSLQSQIHSDLKQLGDQVLEMSSAALGYQKVVEENSKLYNMVEDLKARAHKESSEMLELRANKERCEVLELKAQIESLKKALGSKEIMTPPSKRITDSVRATSEKPKQMTVRTPPPRVRRLSIENGSFMALEKSTNYDDRKAAKTPSVKLKQTDRTPPPRARRLSIENDTIVTAGVSMNHEEKKGAKTPSTTTRSRRLSLEGPRNVQKDSNPIKSPENDTTVIASMNHEEKKGARTPPSTTTRSRRLSLEGPKNVQKDSVPMKSPDMISKITKPEVRSLQIYSQLDPRAPRSPLKSPMIKIDTAKMRLVPLQTPKTPEPQIKSKNEIQRPLLTDRGLSHTPYTTHGKGSQIRKSLRTIGKFINGSDKRNQQKPTEPATPFNGTGLMHDPKSPTSSNARALRRQSLTGIQPPERSRRSSIGGVPTDSFGNESRNAKTPPPQVRASAKLTKRWL